MKKLIGFFFQPGVFGLGIFAFSALSLTMALIAEHVYGLLPCILCLYQRIPFAINIGLGLIIFACACKKYPRATAVFTALAGLVFLGNSGLAFYHVGVEQHWWISAFEACTFDPANIREAVSKPAVPCDEIPWVDPVIGWSMAAWNVVVCGIAGMISFVQAWKIKLAA